MSGRLALEYPERARYGLPAIALHWLLALLILGMLALGYYMVGIPKQTPERGWYLNLHKSFGVLAGMLILLRLGWRLAHAVPPMPAGTTRRTVIAAHAMHRALYLCMILQPLSGYLASSFNKYGVRFFGMRLPDWGWEDKRLHDLFNGVHHLLAVALLVLIAIHALAAAKHLLIDRDRIFQRMLP